MLHGHSLGKWRVLVRVLRLCWKANKFARKLDVFRLCLVHLYLCNFFDSPFDIKLLDDLDELTGLKLSVAENVLDIEQQ
jgi:hypothetical protein